MYGCSGVEILSKHFFDDDDEKKKEFIGEWDNFKFEFVAMRKKWFALKENLARNKLKPKYTATEWALK